MDNPINRQTYPPFGTLNNKTAVDNGSNAFEDKRIRRKSQGDVESELLDFAFIEKLKDHVGPSDQEQGETIVGNEEMEEDMNEKPYLDPSNFVMSSVLADISNPASASASTIENEIEAEASDSNESIDYDILNRASSALGNFENGQMQLGSEINDIDRLTGDLNIYNSLAHASAYQSSHLENGGNTPAFANIDDIQNVDPMDSQGDILNYTFSHDDNKEMVQTNLNVFESERDNISSNRFTFSNFNNQEHSSSVLQDTNAVQQQGHGEPLSFTDRVYAFLSNTLPSTDVSAEKGTFSPHVTCTPNAVISRTSSASTTTELEAISIDDLSCSRIKMHRVGSPHSYANKRQRLDSSPIRFTSEKSFLGELIKVDDMISREAITLVYDTLWTTKVAVGSKLIHAISPARLDTVNSPGNVQGVYAQTSMLITNMIEKLSDLNLKAQELELCCYESTHRCYEETSNQFLKDTIGVLFGFCKSTRRAHSLILQLKKYAHEQGNLYASKMAKLNRIKDRMAILEQRIAMLEAIEPHVHELESASEALVKFYETTGIRIVPVAFSEPPKSVLVVTFNAPMYMRVWSLHKRHWMRDLLQESEKALHTFLPTSTQNPDLYSLDIDMVIHIRNVSSSANGILSSCRPLVLACPTTDSTKNESQTPREHGEHCFAMDLVPSDSNKSPIDHLHAMTATPPNTRLSTYANAQARLVKIIWQQEVDFRDIRVSLSTSVGRSKSSRFNVWQQIKMALVSAANRELECIIPDTFGIGVTSLASLGPNGCKGIATMDATSCIYTFDKVG
ncbi:hypothetical protein BdWA1_000093 [Babesia duncani]|uniref:Uncharacterized protein n=1 Tax=Babesia duncani TaxID=323732 RepID=A0AAD9UPL5_9APIC|nr:hypothetical protein BdWA1_000093 [Babesia duncani]